jgi:hypothetical protein
MNRANPTEDVSTRRRYFLRWPRSIIGPPPGLLEINLVCWGLFIGFEAVPFLISFWACFRAGGRLDYLLPCDFVYFYGIGRVATEYPLSRLYDYALVLKVTNEIYTFKDLVWGPNPYPPFVGLFFSLFARVPFLAAYILWMATSLSLYLAGIAATVKGVFPKQPLKTSLVFCFALGFYPFFICTLKNGQLSSFAFFSLGLAIFLERDSKPFVGGLALSILAYKPTLLLLLLPMLVLTRRFRLLGGFFTGAAGLLLVTTLFGGMDIWPAYAHSLAFFRRFIESQGQSSLQLWEYVDFNSLSYSIPGGRATATLAVLACVSVAAAATLAVTLWRSASSGRPAQDLAWAATLTWALLLNLYVPVWDSILVGIALILTFRALRGLGWNVAAKWLIVLAVLMFAVTWNLISKSNRHGSQLLTLLLFLFGVFQLRLLHQMSRRESFDKGVLITAE